MIADQPITASPALRARARQALPWIALLIIILLTVAVRWHLLSVPLERDEGEYAYAGQLILQGIPPYGQVYNMKLPGIYAAYAIILSIFGQTHRGIHMGLLVINVATVALIFSLTKKLVNDLAAVVAGATFAVLSIGQSVQGVSANAEHFVILAVVGGLVALLRGIDSERIAPLMSGGFLLGLAILMKQHGVAFAAFGAVYLFISLLGRRPRRWKRILWRYGAFSLGATMPYLLTCAILWAIGVFDNFWFWTVSYAQAYVAQVHLELAWSLFKMMGGAVVGAALPLWAMAVVGLTAICWDQRARQRRLFIALFAVFSFLAICPGFFFRPHYFILTLPVVALLVGVAISSVADIIGKTRIRLLKHSVPIGLAVICLGVPVIQQRLYLFSQTPTEVARTTYGMNPFPESLEIAKFVKENTTPQDRVAVIGSEPQILFYADRRSATGYIYTYALMDVHDFAVKMQQEMIREVEASDPAMLIFVNVRMSWLEQPGSSRLIFDWFNRYRKRFYLAALVEMNRNGARYYQGESLSHRDQLAKQFIEIYMRRE